MKKVLIVLTTLILGVAAVAVIAAPADVTINTTKTTPSHLRQTRAYEDLVSLQTAVNGTLSN